MSVILIEEGKPGERYTEYVLIAIKRGPVVGNGDITMASLTADTKVEIHNDLATKMATIRILLGTATNMLDDLGKEGLKL